MRGGQCMNIKSASDLLGISADTIRYYERVGLVPPITRTTTGIRDFKEHDIEALEFIKCFRSAGVSVASLVDYMSLYQKGDGTIGERLGILEAEKKKIEERLSQLQAALNRLNLKIKHYKDVKI